MKTKEWYIEQIKLLRSELDAAYNADTNVGDDFEQHETTAADDVVLRLIMLIYSYDKNLPLNIDAAKLREVRFIPGWESRNVAERRKIERVMDAFTEYLSDLADD
nr:MAG TPA_asm: hypothetical protein [Caudoviricetes sp.]